jgi:hypothetical protein
MLDWERRVVSWEIAVLANKVRVRKNAKHNAAARFRLARLAVFLQRFAPQHFVEGIG